MTGLVCQVSDQIGTSLGIGSLFGFPKKKISAGPAGGTHGDLAKDLHQLPHVLLGRLLQPNLARNAIVAQPSIRRTRDAGLDRGGSHPFQDRERASVDDDGRLNFRGNLQRETGNGKREKKAAPEPTPKRIPNESQTSTKEVPTPHHCFIRSCSSNEARARSDSRHCSMSRIPRNIFTKALTVQQLVDALLHPPGGNRKKHLKVQPAAGTRSVATSAYVLQITP